MTDATHVGSAVQDLLERIDAQDPFDYQLEDVYGLQFAAANERLASARSVMPLVDRRASDCGITRIDAVHDIIPLLFSDATYKSYPESFLAQGRWKALATWLDALSTKSGAADVDFSGVDNLDGWLTRLREAGHYVYVSTGTSGRCSIFQVDEVDRDRDVRNFAALWRWAGLEPNANHPVIMLVPKRGFHRMMDSFGRQAVAFGRQGAVFYLGDEGVPVSEMNAIGRLRREMAAGAAPPSEVEKFERRAAQRQAAMGAQIADLTDAVIRHSREPIMFIGVWTTLFFLLQAAKQRGWDGGVHPDSVVLSGGGRKGVDVPDDYQDQVRTALGIPGSRYFELYGMSELLSIYPRCTAGRYHLPPWVIAMVLDDEGENLIAPQAGRAEGRLAFFDLSLEGHWGALVSGDRGVVNLAGCPCGRPSPAVEEGVTRYADLPGGDDKVSCAGTIDAYLRGMLDGMDQ
ncbi:hypothetical protein [Mycobacterium sp. E1747]|uniref:hypothetical protein n=1 Tax=Mycobacterium sp. E1747 TaxID=1834128 RepID=UPI0007FFCD14|nr:hypothetical protein [Mycobacterium sp. E1747]OBH10424.1 hypothetical protein A5695_22165 [Mycobacterium sp. E1747]